MASAASTRKMVEIATCSMCMNLMTFPVSIPCGHTYCQICIISFYNEQCKTTACTSAACPRCGGLFSLDNCRSNKELQNIIEVIKEMEKKDQETLCGKHGEKLGLFCEDEGQLVCWRCEREAQHKGHTVTFVEDVCQDYREKLQKTVTRLEALYDECAAQKSLVAMQINHWKENIEMCRQKIKQDFQHVQDFLLEEEKSYLWRLETEENQTLSRLRVGALNLEEKSDELRSYIEELKAKCQGSPQKLLQNVRDTLDRSSAIKVPTLEKIPLEIHTTCEVSELYLDVRQMLKRCEVSVTLDPDTAHPDLVLSEDQRQVSRGGCFQENLEASPRRFTAFPCVLGCEGFTSGRHYFEVDVGSGTAWDVGICMETVQRGANMKQEPEFGFWTIRLCKAHDYVALTSTPTPLNPSKPLHLVGIFLDYEAGLVSFYNMTAGSHIFTFPKASFSHTLRPYFQVYQHSPLSLAACNKSAKEEHLHGLSNTEIM
uniref:E3 ubiquitin-protein ligase TRIM38 n=1 Tax=Jaculus jaculus TaxID=51337 RepID=UPI001E1B4CB0|nr:E3 ubiquitin-protein ligase TRIM38 [Jaculus jaculus]